MLQNKKNSKEKSNRIKAYLLETKLEMKRVSWPTKALIARASIIVLFLVIVLTCFISLADFAIAKLFYVFKNI